LGKRRRVLDSFVRVLAIGSADVRGLTNRLRGIHPQEPGSDGFELAVALGRQAC